MRKVNKMMVLKDERDTITYKRVKGRRTLKFFKKCFKNNWDGHYTSKIFVVIGLFSHDQKGEITYLVKKKDDTQCLTNMYHINISWRRLKKRLIADYTSHNYKRFY